MKISFESSINESGIVSMYLSLSSVVFTVAMVTLRATRASFLITFKHLKLDQFFFVLKPDFDYFIIRAQDIGTIIFKLT